LSLPITIKDTSLLRVSNITSSNFPRKDLDLTEERKIK
jgi:hypothetical protein